MNMDPNKFKEILVRSFNDSINTKYVTNDEIGNNKVALVRKNNVLTGVISEISSLPMIDQAGIEDGILIVEITENSGSVSVGIVSNDLRILVIASKFIRKHGFGISAAESQLSKMFFNTCSFLGISLPKIKSEKMAYDYCTVIGDLLLQLKKLKIPIESGNCIQCDSEATLYYPRLCEADLLYMPKEVFYSIRDTLEVKEFTRSLLKISKIKILKILMDLKDFRVSKKFNSNGKCILCGNTLETSNSSKMGAIIGSYDHNCERFWIEPNLCYKCGISIDWVTIQMEVENRVRTYEEIMNDLKSYRSN